MILDNVSWETYTNLLQELNPSAGKRLTYDQGVLQITVVSFRHEKPNRMLASLVEELAAAMDIDFCNSGATTFKRDDLHKGFEPDSSFYFRNVSHMMGVDEVDLSTDPPPDLVIEVDITSPSINKFPIFAAVGVAELWHRKTGKVTIYQLQDGKYVEAAESAFLPSVTGGAITNLLSIALKEPSRLALRRKIKDWLRENRT